MGVKNVKIGPFFGIDNKLPRDGLRVETRYVSGNFLRDAFNVDVDNKGEIVESYGEKCILELPGAHSVYMTSDTAGYVVAASALYAVELPDGLTQLTTLVSDEPMSWVEHNGSVYYSNGIDSGRIENGVVYPLGIATAAPPSLVATAGGLPLGKYQVWAAYSNDSTGEIAGLSPSTSIALTEGDEMTHVNGIVVSVSPLSQAGATHILVFLSSPNGEIPRLAAKLPIGTSVVTLTALELDAVDIMCRYEEPLPAGELFESNGRLCSFKDNIISIGLPYRYGYFLPVEGYLVFKDPIRLAVTNQGGTYVATTKETFWIPGDIGAIEGALDIKLPFGAVAGTLFKHPTLPKVGWFTGKGLVLGDVSGTIEQPMEEHCEVDLVDAIPEAYTPLPARDVAWVTEARGFHQVFSCGWSLNLDKLYATRYGPWGIKQVSRKLGARDDGIVLLGVPGCRVAWFVDFGRINWSAEQLKHTECVYLGLSSTDEVTVTLRTPDEGVYHYRARDYDLRQMIQRANVGKGLRANWYDLVLSGEGVFKLTSVSFNLAVTKRRI